MPAHLLELAASSTLSYACVEMVRERAIAVVVVVVAVVAVQLFRSSHPAL